jgi:3-phenylpropionate/cinnamic acid dioxygenase small subunit
MTRERQRPPAAPAPGAQDLARFIRHEAQLIDERRFDEWLQLFADDGHYWLPMSAEQTDPAMQQSLAWEDKVLLKVRVDRFRHPRTYSDHPVSRCQHILQESDIVQADIAAGRYVTRTPFMYVESREDGQLSLAGTVRHELRVDDGALRIVLKRVDLLNAGNVLPAIRLMP